MTKLYFIENIINENFHIDKINSFKGIKQGIENTNYLLKSKKKKYILTIFEKRVLQFSKKKNPEFLFFFFEIFLIFQKKSIISFFFFEILLIFQKKYH